MTAEQPDAKAPLGLRERRRRQTLSDIHEAAMELFEAKGVAATTVDEIATAAGVSPRTFFRHYPTKESAAYLGDTEFDALIDHVVTLLEQGAPLIQVLDDAWLSHFQQIDEMGKDPVRIIRERRLAESEPAVVVVGIHGGERLNARLADAARRAPGISPDDPTPMAVVAAIGSIAHVAYREWAIQVESGHTGSLRELYLRLRRGVGAYADDLTRIDEARGDSPLGAA